MQFFPGDLLHVYNRGNNKQQIFFNEDNYQFFINKAEKEIGSIADILAYCLMPNHFHFLIQANDDSCKLKRIGALVSTELQNGFRILQSSYARAIKNEFARTGSIFQQNTKLKLLNKENDKSAFDCSYAETCFHYIHQNPVKAGLVSKLEDWKFSSFREYLSSAEKEVCKKSVAFQLFDMKPENIYDISYGTIKTELLEKIW